MFQNLKSNSEPRNKEVAELIDNTSKKKKKKRSKYVEKNKNQLSIFALTFSAFFFYPSFFEKFLIVHYSKC